MDSIKQVTTAEIEPSNYTGSKYTFEMVLKQIKDRWPDQADKYDPLRSCFTYRQWLDRGFRVRRGEKSIRSVTWIDGIDRKTGEERKFTKQIFLFFFTQVDPV